MHCIPLIMILQVSLHNPGDVSVADRSMAVAPGVRALFDIKYSMVSDY
jgi:hypothetical protein